MTTDTGATWTGRDATALRRALCLTAERFAARVCVAPRTVTHWSSNPDTVPQISVQERLSQTLREAPADVQCRFRTLTAGPGRQSTGITGDLVEVLAALGEISQRITQLVEAM